MLNINLVYTFYTSEHTERPLRNCVLKTLCVFSKIPNNFVNINVNETFKTRGTQIKIADHAKI
jgi:hypothetical protein